MYHIASILHWFPQRTLALVTASVLSESLVPLPSPSLSCLPCPHPRRVAAAVAHRPYRLFVVVAGVEGQALHELPD